MSRVILGIDLGTTNTVVAAIQGGKAQVIADAEGRTTQPSVVSFHPGGEVLTGYAAKQRRAIDPRNTLFSIKRLIGRGMHARETREMQARMPFAIVSGDGQTPILRTRAGDFAPAEVSALVLDHVKKLAEKALGHEVSEAVIAVPASFSEAQRSATSAAGSIAGLTVLQVINEPTAAAVAFGYQKNLDDTVAVYDLGGGTFDISILRVKGDTFEVLSSAGDSFLGGDDIDERIVERMVSECLRQHQVDLRGDATALQRLHGVAEQLKIDLGRRTRSPVRASLKLACDREVSLVTGETRERSLPGQVTDQATKNAGIASVSRGQEGQRALPRSLDHALIKVDEIAYGAGGVALDLEMALTRGELEDMAADLIARTFPVCDEALHQAGLTADMISALVLVGGSTRMPLVHEMASKYFQRTPRTDVQPDEAVAIGAALHGQALTSASTLVREISRSSGDSAAREESRTSEVIRVRGESRASEDTVNGNTITENTITENTIAENTIAREQPTIERPTRSVPPPMPRANPSAGTGAKIQTQVRVPVRGAIVEKAGLSHSDQSERAEGRSAAVGPIIFEVTPQALGIATVAGFCEHIIKRNTPIPGQAVRVFATSRDDQRMVRLRVCQGNARKFSDNTELGDLVFDKLVPGPRGKTRIEVTFSLDASSRLQVTARDPDTGSEQSATLNVIGAHSTREQSAASERLRAMRK